MGNRKKLEAFVDRPGIKTVPLTFLGETCGIAEVRLDSGEVYATVIEDSNFDHWLRDREDYSFSVATNNGSPVSAEAFFPEVLDASTIVEGEVEDGTPGSSEVADTTTA